MTIRCITVKPNALSFLASIGLFAFAASSNAQAPEGEASPPAEPAKAAEAQAAPKTIAGIRLSGYLQSQYEHHQGSKDELRSGGGLQNQDRFLIRRARLKAQSEWEYSRFMLELDGNTSSGPALRLYRAEAAVFYKSEAAKAPLVEGTAGLFDIPFGYELLESSRSRIFMERSRASRAFFPSAPDVGAKLSGKFGFVGYAVAIQNGEPIGTKQGFPTQDPNAAKDIAARLSASVEPVEDFEIGGGISMLKGKGFHQGTEAKKASVAWEDRNGDGAVQTDELVGTPAKEATPSRNFNRWLVGADLQLQAKTKLGTTKLYGELQVGSNMDRSVMVADPVALGRDKREVGFYVGVIQDVTRYGVVGFRYDHYDPDADILGGEGDSSKTRIHTFSPMVGLVLPKRARLVFQYDIVNDRLATNQQGLPTDAKNDAWTVRLQVEP